MKEKLLTEIMYLAMMVQMNTEYCVFIRMSGHVDSLEIEICESKSKYTKVVATCSVRTDNEHIKKRAAEIKEVLIRILEDGEVPHDLCEVEEIITHEYHF